MKRDDHVQAATMGLIGGATGFVLGFMVKFGVKEESLFALIGALIGAAATVGGGAWLADYSRRAERNAEISLLIDEYKTLQAAIEATQAVEPTPNIAWHADYRPLLHQLADKAGGTRIIAQEALDHAKALSFRHRASMRRVQFVIENYLAFWTDGISEVPSDPMDERTYPGVIQELAEECRLAIAELDGSPVVAGQQPPAKP